MAIAIIEKWLADPQRAYDHGRQLYDLYGSNKSLKVLFAPGHDGSHYHFSRLTEELRKVSANFDASKVRMAPPAGSFNIPTLQHSKIPTLTIPKLEDIPVPDKRHSLTEAEWGKTPDPIKDLYTLNSRLHAHTQLLFNQSRITEDQERRRVLDLTILRERDQINENWKTIKDFHANGVVKEELQKTEKVEIDNMSIAELVRLSKNIPTYLSKDREKLAGMPDGPKKNKVLARIMEREVQFELVKKRLEA